MSLRRNPLNYAYGMTREEYENKRQGYFKEVADREKKLKLLCDMNTS